MLKSVPTRALSILQPWAHAIVHLGKRIENRDWLHGCRFRGEILIHASKGVGSVDTFDQAIESICSIRNPFDGIESVALLADSRAHGPRWKPSPLLQRGGIVGRARVIGEVFVDMTRQANVCDGPEHGVRSREMTPTERLWWTGGFALVLADVEPLPFVPCKGALGLWTVPEDVRLAIAQGARS